MSRRSGNAAWLAGALACAAPACNAAQWSDTALGLRYGTAFAEPFNNDATGARVAIRKAALSLTNATGQSFGSTFVNIDVLKSDDKDPQRGEAGRSGAREVYGVFRVTLDAGKLAGRDLGWGLVRGVGLTGGVDINTKNDGYGSRKRMAVLGPTLMLDVPGFLNLSALWLAESNRPRGIERRFHYRPHLAWQADWGLALGASAWRFQGYAMHIAAKGRNEFGAPTAAETHLDAALMLDLGATLGSAPHRWRVGVGYEYWRNKFGNPTTTGPFQAGQGATASTPMLRLQWQP